MSSLSSRRRFAQYQAESRNREPGIGKHDRPRPGGRSFWQLLRAFLYQIRAFRWQIAFSLVTLSLATLIKLVPPAAIKVAVDLVLTAQSVIPAWISEWGLPTDRYSLLWLIAVGVTFTSLLASIIHLWGRWFATRTVNRVQVTMRKRVFEHAMHLPLFRIFELKSGGASSLIREDAGGAAELVFSMIYNPCRAVVQLIGTMLILTWVDWRLMAGGLLVIPLVYVTHRTWIQRIRPLWRDVRSQRQEIDGYVTEAFGGMRIVRSFSRERTESSRFVSGNNLLIRKQLFAWWWSRTVELVWDALIPVASTGVLVYCGSRILNGTMTLGDLTMFLFYLAMLLEPLATLVSSAASFQNNLAGLERVLEVLEEPREMAASDKAITILPDDVSGNIVFRNVSFQYPKSDRTVLSSVNLEVAGGETIALVGRSGAGKTTLCNLVARFYDPTHGEVSLDGRSLCDIRVDSYRRLLGIVEQDVFLFDGSISENIGYGRRGASQELIMDAARAANAHDFIVELDQGYETVIGERGVKLSGGQRQRLAIARALLADPKILILDEATSNLDSESERLIQDSLRLLMRGRTCFVIAHRMSTIGLADRIAVLEDGHLAAVGRHDELMRMNPTYQRMVELQTISVEPPLVAK